MVKQLLEFINDSPSMFHAVANVEGKLIKKGYTYVPEDVLWNVVPGGLYYTKRNDSALIAFRVPKEEMHAIRITAAHSDSPAFKIKENPEIRVEGQYTKLNTEKYGGMLMQPWLDRPLSIAGRVILRDGGGIKHELVDLCKPCCIIPNLAIHMNRKANEEATLNAQVDMLPLWGQHQEATLKDVLAEKLQVSKEDILGTDLYLYNAEKGIVWGEEEEFFSARAIDDLEGVFCTLEGFLQARDSAHVLQMFCVLDNEEVGSTTMQGADSTFLSDVVERIFACLQPDVQKQQIVLRKSKLLSVDNGHAVHPNHPEMADPTNRPYMNGGIVLKYNAAQKYCTDGASGAAFRLLCEKAEVPVQTYHNKSDIPGGSTLGNISIRHISVESVDIGLAQLAMHSVYETAGTRDVDYMYRGVKAFFEEC